MLVLCRRIGEKVVIPDYDVTITVLDIEGSRIRLGISAPDQVSIHREEVVQQIRQLVSPLGDSPAR